jgi:hypothetical protein
MLEKRIGQGGTWEVVRMGKERREAARKQADVGQRSLDTRERESV